MDVPNFSFGGNLDDFKIYVKKIAKKGEINSQEYETILDKMNKQKRIILYPGLEYKVV